MSEITRCAAVCLHCCSHISFPKVSLHLFNHFLFISFSGCMYEKYRNVSRCLVAYRRSTNHKATPESRRVFPYVTIIFGGCSSRDEKPLFPQLWWILKENLSRLQPWGCRVMLFLKEGFHLLMKGHNTEWSVVSFVLGVSSVCVVNVAAEPTKRCTPLGGMEASTLHGHSAAGMAHRTQCGPMLLSGPMLQHNSSQSWLQCDHLGSLQAVLSVNMQGQRFLMEEILMKRFWYRGVDLPFQLCSSLLL